MPVPACVDSPPPRPTRVRARGGECGGVWHKVPGVCAGGHVRGDDGSDCFSFRARVAGRAAAD
eukprot:11173237-Lingulodinium_polyedra.AAC.1